MLAHPFPGRLTMLSALYGCWLCVIYLFTSSYLWGSYDYHYIHICVVTLIPNSVHCFSKRNFFKCMVVIYSAETVLAKHFTYWSWILMVENVSEENCFYVIRVNNFKNFLSAKAVSPEMSLTDHRLSTVWINHGHFYIPVVLSRMSQT